MIKFVQDKIDDMKAQNVVTLDVSNKNTITDTLIICSGTSKRHVQAIAENVALEAKSAGIFSHGVEGLDDGEWVLLDLGGVVLHVMQEQTRDFYQLEKLWG